MDIIGSVSLMISASALLFSGVSVFYSTTVKAYEIFINERMQIYQKIKNCFQELRGLTKKHEISKYCRQNRSDDYSQQLREKYNQLESLLTQTEPQEYFLMRQTKSLIDMAVGICGSGQQCSDSSELDNEAEITFLFADIYCWALWLYIQDLHKFRARWASYHNMFDKNFKKVYKRAKRLHKEPPADFFNEYPLKKILGKRIQGGHKGEQ